MGFLPRLQDAPREATPTLYRRLTVADSPASIRNQSDLRRCYGPVPFPKFGEHRTIRIPRNKVNSDSAKFAGAWQDCAGPGVEVLAGHSKRDDAPELVEGFADDEYGQTSGTLGLATATREPWSESSG